MLRVTVHKQMVIGLLPRHLRRQYRQQRRNKDLDRLLSRLLESWISNHPTPMGKRNPQHLR